MEIERILAESQLLDGVKVVTLDRINPESIPGIHATCSTFVSDGDGTFPREPVATYVSVTAANIGHDIEVERLERAIVESKLVAAGGHRSLAGGAL